MPKPVRKLPKGLLSKWLLLVGLVAVSTGIQGLAFSTSSSNVTQRLYSQAGNEATALVSRLFGCWTLAVGILRIYCAYNIKQRAVYLATLWSFIIAFAHFIAEVELFHTAQWDVNTISPVIVSGI